MGWRLFYIQCFCVLLFSFDNAEKLINNKSSTSEVEWKGTNTLKGKDSNLELIMSYIYNDIIIVESFDNQTMLLIYPFF